MTREKAIERILANVRLDAGFRPYVERTLDRLGCGEQIDKPTVEAVEQYIRNDFR